MATYIPPLEILPIFDSLVYSEANGYLTPTVANKRYLNFPNAQGLENFLYGLNSDEINAITTGGTIFFYDNLTGIIYIARNATNALIGNATSLTTIQSINAHITSASSDLYATSTGTLNIGNLTSIINVGINNAGNINLGTGLSTINVLGTLTTGLLNASIIYTPTPSSVVNLYTNITTGMISIGGPANTGVMVLYGSNVIINNQTTQSIQAINVNNNVNLFTTSVSPASINIGSSTSTTNLYGSVIMSGSSSMQNIISPAPALASSIYGTTTATITIGNIATTITIPGFTSLINPRYGGAPINFLENSSLIPPTSWIYDNFGHKSLVNNWTQPQYMDGGMVSNAFYTNSPTAIGNIFSNTTGAVNIGYTSSAIGIGQAQSSSDTIIIGNTGSIVNIFGSTYFQNVNLDDIVAVSTAGPLSLWGNLTGQANIVNNSNDINIGTTQPASSTIKIGTATNSTVSVNGTLRTQSIFAPTGSLATVSGVYSTNTGVINIGGTTATPTVRGNLQLNNSITIGYSVLPTFVNTQVGYINTINTASRSLASSPAGTFNTLASYAVPVGVWSITVSARIPSQVTNNNFILSLSTSATVRDDYRLSIVHTDGSSFIYRDNMTHVVVGGQTWYYIISSTLTASITYQFIGMVATRIA